MDFITGQSKVNGKDCIFVVVGRLTKYAPFMLMPSEFKAPRVVGVEWLSLHNIPNNIAWIQLYQHDIHY